MWKLSRPMAALAGAVALAAASMTSFATTLNGIERHIEPVQASADTYVGFGMERPAADLFAIAFVNGDLDTAVDIISEHAKLPDFDAVDVLGSAAVGAILDAATNPLEPGTGNTNYSMFSHNDPNVMKADAGVGAFSVATTPLGAEEVTIASARIKPPAGSANTS